MAPWDCFFPLLVFFVLLDHRRRAQASQPLRTDGTVFDEGRSVGMRFVSGGLNRLFGVRRDGILGFTMNTGIGGVSVRRRALIL